MFSSRTRRQKAFTLVELLVVIAVISVLAGLLLPALQGAVAQARTIQCTSNLRQIAMGIASYTDDNAGWFPVSHRNDGRPGRWRTETSSYAGVEGALDVFSVKLRTGIFLCPEFKLDLSPKYFCEGGYGWNNSYMGTSDVSATANFRRQRLSGVRLPTKTILCGDTSDTLSSPGAFWEPAMLLRPGAPNPNPVSDRHRGNANMVWADFHVTTNTQAFLYASDMSLGDYYYQRIK